jgi:hypothetical protein
MFGLLLTLLYQLSSPGTDAVGRMSAMITLSKVWIGLVQIVSQLEFSLEVDWPAAFDWFVDLLKLFSLDLLGLIDIGCVHHDFYNKFVFALLLMPLLIGAIGVIYLVQNKKGADGINERCFQMALIAIFLSYPTVSSTVFQGFSCHSLGSDEQWLAVDFQVNCDSDG